MMKKRSFLIFLLARIDSHEIEVPASPDVQKFVEGTWAHVACCSSLKNKF
jgi:hypothetical protein